jgi:glucose/arabinose dehydrogenase
MKHILFWSFILASTNLLCSQSDDTINDADHNTYGLELIYDQVKIPWSIEFIDENTIVFCEKEGKIFILNDGKTQEVFGVPKVYLRGQGGLLDLELHPEFDKNKWLYMSYASGSKAEGGGHTAIGRGQLVDNKLKNFEVLYKG